MRAIRYELSGGPFDGLRFDLSFFVSSMTLVTAANEKEYVYAGPPDYCGIETHVTLYNDDHLKEEEDEESINDK